MCDEQLVENASTLQSSVITQTEISVPGMEPVTKDVDLHFVVLRMR